MQLLQESVWGRGAEMLSKFVPIRYANVVSCLTWAGLLLPCGFIRMEALQLAGPSIQPQQTLSISGKDTIPTRQASAIETTAASSNSSTAIQPRSAMPATSYPSAVSGANMDIATAPATTRAAPSIAARPIAKSPMIMVHQPVHVTAAFADQDIQPDHLTSTISSKAEV